MTNNYYITFAERYRTDIHPLHTEVTPDGYVTVTAQDVEEAHRIAYREFNAYYTDIRSSKPELPEGELWTLS